MASLKLIDDPLRDWADWNLTFRQKPDLISRLSSGLTNRSYLIQANKQKYVLRINASNSDALGIDRKREKTIIEKASSSDLAPAILYCSVEHQILIAEYIDGKKWQAVDLQNKRNKTLLTDKLEQIHSLKLATPPFNYYEHAENYWQSLLDKNGSVAEELSREREVILSQIKDHSASNIICHHDPNPNNILVKSNKLFFIDWEYAAPGWPALDYAALSVEWAISISQLNLPKDIKVDEVLEAIEFYNYLCKLWAALQEGGA
jgi:thiamine kinase